MKNVIIIYAFAYFALISIITAIVTIYDKQCAKKNRRRISEKTLFLFAAFGGSLFEYLTMRLIHHKTLHKRFMIGLPLIILAQIAVLVAVILKFSPMN